MSLSGHQGKVATVTGAGNGIGRATAQRLSREGAFVACADLDGAAAEAVAGALPGESLPVAADRGRVRQHPYQCLTSRLTTNC
jgi:NAD(P)-dependent dehydrogenase (short-subunit alcohol dehydrogenase family)